MSFPEYLLSGTRDVKKVDPLLTYLKHCLYTVVATKIMHLSAFTVTGQKHGGFAGLLEKLGEKLTHALWMDREDMKDRANFQVNASRFSIALV